MSSTKGRHVLGDLTTRLAAEFAKEGGEESLTPPMHRAKGAATQLMEFTGVSAQLEDATRELAELKREHAAGFEVALDSLVDGAYHIGPINEERLSWLVKNLAKNPLNSPIVVRETSRPGIFEIVAGRHRVQAFKVLARSTITAVLRKLSDDETERLVFYDNLLAPTLSDYEKYLGFAKRQKSKNMTHEQLANEAGVTQQWVSALLAIDRLPAGARDLISNNPTKPGISGKLFSELAPLADSHAQRVVDAVQRVIEGKLSVAAAAGWVRGTNPSIPPSVERVVVKRGRSKFAEVRTRGSQWVVDFANPDDAREYGQRFLELLKSATEGSASDK